MTKKVFLSPAKLNLFLRVQNKREDGFHNIVTLFERINLFDKISLEILPGKTIRIKCNHPHVPLGSKNLVHKVARMLQEDLGVEKGVEITIDKKIPVAAGLAGGSSNAATVLLGLNKLWGLKLSQNKLVSYAKRIGSDVAFFLYDATWGLGVQRGDKIKRININTQLWHILVVPRVKVYSAQIYQELKGPFPRRNQTRSGSSRNMQDEHMNVLTKLSDDANILIRNLKEGNILEAGKLLINDLELEIIRLFPRLLSLKERLKSLKTQGVMISGSGPSVFGLTNSEQEALEIKKVLSRRFSQVFVVKTF